MSCNRQLIHLAFSLHTTNYTVDKRGIDHAATFGKIWIIWSSSQHHATTSWNTETDLSRARTQLSREASTTGPLCWPWHGKIQQETAYRKLPRLTRSKEISRWQQEHRSICSALGINKHCCCTAPHHDHDVRVAVVAYKNAVGCRKILLLLVVSVWLAAESLGDWHWLTHEGSKPLNKGPTCRWQVSEEAPGFLHISSPVFSPDLGDQTEFRERGSEIAVSDAGSGH